MNTQHSIKSIGGGSVLALLFVLLAPSMTVWAQQAPAEDKPILEPTEWTDIWVTSADKEDLPRVLFVGDSIVKGYFRAAEKGLAGKSNCGRLATSAFISHEDFLANLKILLKRYHWDVIHINNGLQGWGITDLFSLSIDHADHHRGDGTHFSPKGIAAQGKFVSATISNSLTKTTIHKENR